MAHAAKLPERLLALIEEMERSHRTPGAPESQVGDAGGPAGPVLLGQAVTIRLDGELCLGQSGCEETNWGRAGSRNRGNIGVYFLEGSLCQYNRPRCYMAHAD